MDQTETKSIKLKFYLEFKIVNNLLDFQKSERLIARTDKKLNLTLLQPRNKTSNIFRIYIQFMCRWAGCEIQLHLLRWG